MTSSCTISPNCKKRLSRWSLNNNFSIIGLSNNTKRPNRYHSPYSQSLNRLFWDSKNLNKRTIDLRPYSMRVSSKNLKTMIEATAIKRRTSYGRLRAWYRETVTKIRSMLGRARDHLIMREQQHTSRRELRMHSFRHIKICLREINLLNKLTEIHNKTQIIGTTSKDIQKIMKFITT
jgi:hypothetical protein